MPTIAINGWKIDVENDGSSYESSYIGESGRSFSNRPKRLHRGKAKTANFTTVPMSSEDADTLEGMLEVGGQYWPFVDSLFSSSGVGPEPYSGTVDFLSFSTNSDYGFPPDAGILRTSNALIYNVGANDDYTVMFLYGASSTLNQLPHFTFRSDDRYWISQRPINAGTARENAAFSAVTISNGSLVISPPGQRWISQLVFFPFKVSANFIENFSRLAVPFSRFPFVHVSGDFTDKEYVRAIGSVGSQSYSKKTEGGSTVNSRRSVQFSIEEADPLPPAGTLPYSPAFSVSFDDVTSVSGKRFPVAGSHVAWTSPSTTYTRASQVGRSFNDGKEFSDSARLFALHINSLAARETAPESVIKSFSGSRSIAAIVISQTTSVSTTFKYFFDCRNADQNFAALSMYQNLGGVTFQVTSDMTSSETRSISVNKPLSNGVNVLVAYGASANFETGRLKIGYAYVRNVPATEITSSMSTDLVTTFVSPMFKATSSRPFYLTQNYTSADANKFQGYSGTISLIRDTEITESMLRAAIRAFANGILK